MDRAKHIGIMLCREHVIKPMSLHLCKPYLQVNQLVKIFRSKEYKNTLQMPIGLVKVTFILSFFVRWARSLPIEWSCVSRITWLGYNFTHETRLV
jgi:hypothetical protein